MTSYRIKAEEKKWVTSHITLEPGKGMKQEKQHEDLAGWADNNKFTIQKVSKDGEVINEELAVYRSIQIAEYTLTLLEEGVLDETALQQKEHSIEELEEKLDQLKPEENTQ